MFWHQQHVNVNHTDVQLVTQIQEELWFLNLKTIQVEKFRILMSVAELACNRVNTHSEMYNLHLQTWHLILSYKKEERKRGNSLMRRVTIKNKTNKKQTLKITKHQKNYSKQYSKKPYSCTKYSEKAHH